MIDLNYQRQLEECFKKNVNECPFGISDDIHQIVEEKKEKRREEIRRKIEESKLKKKYGNNVSISWELSSQEKRKQATIERLQSKLMRKREIAD